MRAPFCAAVVEIVGVAALCAGGVPLVLPPLLQPANTAIAAAIPTAYRAGAAEKGFALPFTPIAFVVSIATAPMSSLRCASIGSVHQCTARHDWREAESAAIPWPFGKLLQ